MRLSAKAEYACLALLELARTQSEDAPRRAREIADAHEIPERYLVQIFQQLKGAGLVYSARGSTGGYRLARPADAITVAEVLAVIDGPSDPPRGPRPAASQALAELIDEARTAYRRILMGTSLAELAGRTSSHDWVL